MKNCLYCGRDTKSDLNICESCKQKLLAADMPNNHQPSQNDPQKGTEQNKRVIIKFKKNLAVLTAFAAPLIFIILIISFSYVKKPYALVLEEYFDGLKTADAAKIINTYPESYIGQLEHISENLHEIIEKNIEENLKRQEQELGSDIYLSYKIIRAEKSDDRALAQIQDTLKNDYNLEEISDAYNIELEITAKSSNNSKSFNSTVEIIKIDDRWYISPTTSFVLFFDDK
ncbi:MAG TPA: hypothetical protein GXX17_02245 [Clostridiales bacterium]|nr:hypothetical protein [Clostridiales bacterium]